MPPTDAAVARQILASERRRRDLSKLILAALLVGLSSAAWAGNEISIGDLLAAERQANGVCRGQSGDKPKHGSPAPSGTSLTPDCTRAATAGQYEYQKTWHPCGAVDRPSAYGLAHLSDIQQAAGNAILFDRDFKGRP
jgi:hypothetical protein